MPTIEFFYDFSSPYTYLASTRIRAIAERTGAKFEPKPFVLGAVFKATGNSAPASVPAKALYLARDTKAWADTYGVPFALPSDFPTATIKAARMALAIDDPEKSWAFVERTFRAYWGESRDINDPAVLSELATGLGLDARHLLARIEQQDVKDRLRANTDDAIARGAFGAPTIFVGDQMFVGNDRLSFVERAARGERVYRD